jgi:DNA-binding GntR family transcriptional regulator
LGLWENRPAETLPVSTVLSPAFAKDQRHRTKQEFVYRTLRDAIIRCDLQPGERLVIDDLARRLEVSAIPVREALQLLQSERLVVNVPHVGATVAPISRDSILEVFTVLEGLEMVAAREAAARASGEQVERLGDVVNAMDRAVAAHKLEEWADLNTRFHLAFSRLTGMPLLEEMMAKVLVHWDRVRRHFFSGVLMHRVERAQEEHRSLLQALEQRDTTRMEEIVRRHNRGALAAYTAYLEQPIANRQSSIIANHQSSILNQSPIGNRKSKITPI